jgi:hypothetical protein
VNLKITILEYLVSLLNILKIGERRKSCFCYLNINFVTYFAAPFIPLPAAAAPYTPCNTPLVFNTVKSHTCKYIAVLFTGVP